MKIIHIINSLKKGGAEGNLYRLCRFHKYKYKNNIDIIIITLIKNGYYQTHLKKLGVKIYSLNLDQKINFFEVLKKINNLRNLVKKQNPDVVQSWMYHSNFISAFLPKKFYQKLFWNIRHSELNLQISKRNYFFINYLWFIIKNYTKKNYLLFRKKY